MIGVNKRLSPVFLLVLSLAFVYAGAATSTANAQDGTLADAINSTVNHVDWNAGDSWTTNWAVILANQGPAAFDNAMAQDINRGDYIDALFVARLAQLSGYGSEVIFQGTQTALEQMAMCGSLPITANAHGYGDPDKANSGCYLVYHRFALWGYQYAGTYGLGEKWNATQAFTSFSNAYDKRPSGSASGEMLWCDPQENWAASYSSRYYDEHAETLSVFLKLAEQGVPEAMVYADKVWTGVQGHWSGQYFGYTGTSTVECEMGNFAQVIAEYKDQKGGVIPYWDRVISDLNYKLLASRWSSPGWANPGVIVHAKGLNSELRLMETMGAVIALQTQYPHFISAMKTNWQSMLMGSSPAWQGLMASALNRDGYFRGTSTSSQSNDATVCAAATLFLEGIVPVTGSLNIPNREEYYNDLRTPFSIQDFKFDYANRSITVPLNAGQVTFIYGAVPVSYNFPSNGVYTIQFSSDWNAITAVNDEPVVASEPTAPQNLAATAGNGQVTLAWSHPVSNGGAQVTTYTIYKGAQGQEVVVASLPATSTGYTDTSVANGQTYYYYVTAANIAGESVPSNEASATPTAPKAMAVTVKTDKQTYSRGSTVHVTITAKDSSTSMPLSGSARVSVTSPNGRTATTRTVPIDSDGSVVYDYRLSSGVQRGVYTIRVTVTSAGYPTVTARTTFRV